MGQAARSTASGRGHGELDELTLRRAQRGDEAAWRALVARHQHAVHGLIWRLLAGRARHRTEDLAQETFVRVIRALPRFDPQGPATLTTWILTIATRLALNELRRPEMRALADEPAAVEDAHAPVERRRLAARIGAAMAELPPYQRAAIVLRELHGLDYAEIASALDIDLGTVKSRLARARAALREALAEEQP
jgi:RNA polymerase sigma-70 factor (ECF subfamily)|nr:sigma-70 family RNA polymerase sigma factor [Kofleriaceae bacterium]